MAASIVPPVTYSGVLPCVACVGRQFTLSLRPDGLFLLRQVYLSKEKGKDKTLVEQGSWRSTTDGGRLSLWGGIELHRQFAIRDADTLRMLDDRGREIQSTLNYDLVRSKTFDPIEQPFRKRWMYVREADRGFAIDCIKGLRFPVAEERDMAALNTAYQRPNRGGRPAGRRIRRALRSATEGTRPWRRGSRGCGQISSGEFWGGLHRLATRWGAGEYLLEAR